MKNYHRMRAWDGETLWPFARYTLDGKKVEVSKQENGLNNKFIDSDECFVKLCSGLRDKKGNLIYEGHIGKDEEGIIAPIYFCSGCFWFGILLLFQNNSKIEIIGTINQNPELLEEK